LDKRIKDFILDKKILQYINNMLSYNNIADTYSFLDFIYNLSSEGHTKSELIEVMTSLSNKFEDESVEYTVLTDMLDFLTGYCSTKNEKINDFIIYFRNLK
jgi:hypothetical protein